MDARTIRSWAWGIAQVALLVVVVGFVIYAVWSFAELRAHAWHGRRG